MDRRLFFGIGFAAWLLATIVFRLAGHVFFKPENPPMLAYVSVILAAFLPAKRG